MVRPRVSHLLVAAAIAAALLAGFDGLDPTPAKARRGYGGRGGYCRAGCQVKRCNKVCKQAKRTCVYCVKQDLKPVLAACRGNAGSARKACRANVKGATKTAIQQCAGRTGACGQCCRTNYSGGCTQSFADTSGFGSYFRTERSYGKVRRYRPECDGSTDGTGGSGGGGRTCSRSCDQARAVALKRCKRGCDTAAIEATHQACITACDGGTTTTTITTATTTTITLPGSPGGAFLRR